MKILNFRFRMEEDARENARAIQNIVYSLRSPSLPDVVIAPIINPPPDFSGISLSGDEEAMAVAADRLRQMLRRRAIEFTEEETPRGADAAEPVEAVQESASQPVEGFEGVVREGQYGFVKLAADLPAGERTRWHLERTLKSGIRFFRLGMYEDSVRQLTQAIEMESSSSEAHHYLGLAYEQMGRFEEAADALQQSISRDPDAAASYFYLANVHQKQGKLEEAIAEYKKAIELDPDVPVVYNNLGWVFYQMGEHDKAQRSFEEAISLDPDLPFAHNGLACVHQDMGNLQDAIAEFKQAIEIFPGYTAAHLKLGWAHLLMGDVHAAIEALKNAAQTAEDPQYSISANYSLAHAYMSQNQVELAHEHFEKVLREDPDFVDALFHSGETLVRLGEFEMAVRRLLQYLENAEDVNAEVYKLLASAYFHLGRFRDATAACKEALKTGPADHEIYEMLGNIAVSRDKFKQAEQQFKKALALNSDSAFSHFQLGWIYENTDRTAEAVEQYKKAIQLDPEATEAYNNLGWLYTQQSKNEEALVIFEKALEISPQDEDLINNLAWTYALTGNFREALEQYRRGLALNPDSSILQSNLGIVHYKMGAYPEAQASIERALHLSGDETDYAVAHYYLGLLQQRESHTPEAVQHFQQAVRLDPDYPEPYFPLGQSLAEMGKPEKAARALKQYLKLSPRGEFATRASELLANSHPPKSLPQAG